MKGGVGVKEMVSPPSPDVITHLLHARMVLNISRASSRGVSEQHQVVVGMGTHFYIWKLCSDWLSGLCKVQCGRASSNSGTLKAGMLNSEAELRGSRGGVGLQSL